MKTKSWLLPIALVASLPLISLVVACNKTDTPVVAVDDKTTNNGETISPAPDPLALNFTFNNEVVNVPADNLYLVPNTFKGELWSGTKSAGSALNPAAPVALEHDKSVGFGLPAYELASGDSVFVLFDEDQNDGISIDSFNDNFYVYDTANQQNQALKKANTDRGNLISPLDRYGNLWLKFQDGQSRPALTQNEDVKGSFAQALAQVKPELNEDEFKALESYYKRASKIFKPVIWPEGLFTAQKVARNAMRITFNLPTPEAFSIKAAGFVLTNKLTLPNADSTNSLVQIYGEFAFGSLGWSAYEAQETREFKLLSTNRA